MPFFNPIGYKNKKKNFDIFRRNIRNQRLPLLSIELAFHDRPYELKQSDGEIVIHVRSDSIMWQRERMYNIALEHLPEYCKYVVFLDGDIIFLNPDWHSQTASLLEQYPAVQPFEYLYQLGKNEDYSEITINKLSSYKGSELIKGAANKLKEKKSKYIKNLLHTGFSWSYRRDFLEKIGGWYDRSPIGGIDKIFITSLLGSGENFIKNYRPYEEKECLEWADMIYKESEGNFHYTPGYLLHLWHGDKKYRLYSYRHKRMHEFGYDPQNDLTFNKDQCWEWNTSDQKLIRWVKYYFYARNEESKFYTYLYNKIISFQFNLRKRLQNKVKED